MRNRATLAVLAVTATVLAAGCTPTPAVTAAPTPAPTTAAPTTPSATPTQTPTPSPTLSADQEAALKAVKEYKAAMARLNAKGTFDQYGIIKALRPTTTDPMIQAALNALRAMWKRGVHNEGSQVAVWTKVGQPTDVTKGVSVKVTMCIDQREVTVVNKKGKVQKDSYPDFFQGDYEMRRGTKEASPFKVYEIVSQAVGGCDQ